jgi:hypothetical protein
LGEHVLAAIRDFIGQNWLSTTISILAVVYAVYEARRRRGPRLAFQFAGSRLIGGQQNRLPEKVQINFRGVPIANLSQTQIILWNKGDAPLRRVDVPSNDPLRFKLDSNCKIFLAQVIKVSREVNNVGIDYESGLSNSVELSFDFFDKGDGVLVSIWHDSNDTTAEMEGTVLGQREGLLNFGRIALPRRNVSVPSRASSRFEKLAIFFARQISSRGVMSYMPIVMMGLGVGMGIGPVAHDLGIPFSRPSTASDGFKAVGVAAGLLYAATGFWFYLATRRRFPKALIPDEYLPVTQDRATSNEPS